MNLPSKYLIPIFNKKRLIFVQVFCFLFLGMSVIFEVVTIRAQSHPGMDSFQLPEEAKGDFYFFQGKYKEALEFYKSMAKEKNNYIFRNMVRAWKAIEALDEAEQYLNDYRSSYNDSSAVYYALGYLNYLKDENGKAEELFMQAVKLDPGNGLAWNNWAACLSERNQFQEAMEKVRTAIQSDPKELMFFFNLKKIYEDMGEEQRFELEYVALLNEGSSPLVWGYGKTLVRSIRQKSSSEYSKGNIVGAITGFEKVLDIYLKIKDLNGQVPALFSLGLLYEESGDAQKAHKYFEKVLKINPNHIQAREKMKPRNH